MLKKTGIIVVAATAGLLAASPLAFAHEGHQAPAGDCNIAQSTGDATQSLGLLGVLDLNDVVSDLNVAVPICDNNVNVQVIPVLSPNTQNN